MAAQSFNLGERLPDRAWEDDHVATDLNLRDFFNVLRRRNQTVIIVFVMVMSAALIYLVVAPKHYFASSAILIDPKLGHGLSADPGQPNSGSDANAIDSQVKLLTSQEVLTRVIRSRNLVHDSEFGIKRPNFLVTLLGLAKEPSDDDLTPVLKALDEAITIKRPERTYLVEIQVSSKDPVKAANLANAVAQAYIDDQIANRVESASSDSKWVNEHMDALQKQILLAEDKVEAFKSQNHVVNSEGLLSNEQQISDLTKELGAARARESEAKAKLDQIRRAVRTNRLDAQSDALKSVTIERLRGEQADAERDVAKLAKTLGDRHPALQEAIAVQAKVKQLIQAELRRIEVSTADDYATAHANELQLAANIDQLKMQSNTTSTNLVPLHELEREVDALHSSYERFAKIRNNLTEQESDSPPARIVTVARPPLSASTPRKPIILFLAAAAGLFAGIAGALIQENLQKNLLENDLERDLEHDSPRNLENLRENLSSAPHSGAPPRPGTTPASSTSSARRGFRNPRYLDDQDDERGDPRW